ncbi:hypothetical protein K402DRAFT_407615 [Aulographum hederae CBS 113979]|uniref:BTB domain-containing protein n=1 Tax=Aulographum hederae CBS 113979 TaxID=1176131 RepID=A0A6G1GNB5_9PEZI|nr:hypothetical protein K402DRAFT_407615 [Aulographum hederae CBS 113979]
MSSPKARYSSSDIPEQAELFRLYYFDYTPDLALLCGPDGEESVRVHRSVLRGASSVLKQLVDESTGGTGKGSQSEERPRIKRRQIGKAISGSRSEGREDEESVGSTDDEETQGVAECLSFDYTHSPCRQQIITHTLTPSSKQQEASETSAQEPITALDLSPCRPHALRAMLEFIYIQSYSTVPTYGLDHLSLDVHVYSLAQRFEIPSLMRYACQRFRAGPWSHDTWSGPWFASCVRAVYDLTQDTNIPAEKSLRSTVVDIAVEGVGTGTSGGNASVSEEVPLSKVLGELAEFRREFNKRMMERREQAKRTSPPAPPPVAGQGMQRQSSAHGGGQPIVSDSGPIHHGMQPEAAMMETGMPTTQRMREWMGLDRQGGGSGSAAVVGGPAVMGAPWDPQAGQQGQQQPVWTLALCPKGHEFGLPYLYWGEKDVWCPVCTKVQGWREWGRARVLGRFVKY